MVQEYFRSLWEAFCLPANDDNETSMGVRCPLGFWFWKGRGVLIFFSISVIIIVLVNCCINIFLGESKLNVFPENCYILLRYGILSFSWIKSWRNYNQVIPTPLIGKHGIFPAELIWERKIFLNENFEHNNHSFVFRFIFIGRGSESNSWP